MTEHPVKRYGFIILLVTLFCQITFTEGGLYHYIKTQMAIKSIAASIEKTKQENIALTRELDKLQTDDQYLEDVVRKKYGFVRDGERLYRVDK